MGRKIFVIILAIAFIAVGITGIRLFVTYKADNTVSEAVVYVYRNATCESITDSLEASGSIRNMKSFRRAAGKMGLSGHFEPGRYVIRPGMSNQYIVRMMVNGWQTPFRVTLRGYIKTIDRMSAFLGKHFEADSAEFAAALQDRGLIDSLGFKPETLIGMFIPNTYEFYWTTPPVDVLKRFKTEYERFWEGERDKQAKRIGLSRIQVITLASIIIGETNNTDEMPKIAGVYMNRLRKGMRLQACPTVIYAHLETEPGLSRLLNRHLQVDSPYNTYKIKGLPPGPIAVPTVAAIDAVLNYEKSDYLYFCAKPEFDGTHNFASTYSQHMANSRAYNKAYKAREASRNAANAA